MTTRPDATVADRVAAATRSVPGVAGLHPGAYGEVATYLPGRRITGVRVGDDRTEVHVIVRFGVPVLATADAVRAAVLPLVGTRVDVGIEDVTGT